MDDGENNRVTTLARRNGPVNSVAAIHAAARGRVLLWIVYNGELRPVEPYSYRTRGSGNTLFYAFCLLRGSIRSFRLDRITAAWPSSVEFSPRWPVEL